MFTTIISTADLAAHLDDPNFVIADCRFKLDDIEAGRYAYFEAHVPGAVYAHLDYDLSGRKTGTNGRHPLPSPQLMNATFSAWGITTDSQVVAYDDAASGLGAGRMWWMLRYMGHEQVAVLDGGWQAWQTEGRPVEDGIVIRTPTTFLGRPRPEMRRDADSLVGLKVIDSRAPIRYRGEQEPIDKVAGHIPGALNFHFGNVFDNAGRMLPPDQLRAKLRGAVGDTPPEQCVFYCGSGASAVMNLLAMEVAGLPGGKLYPGSWSEWISDPTRPIARGDQP